MIFNMFRRKIQIDPNSQTAVARLMIAETSSSTWNYHLRMVVPGEEKFSGGAGKAVCGYDKMGWDTQIPLNTYGKKASHIPEKYCAECLKIARKENLLGVDEID